MINTNQLVDEMMEIYHESEGYLRAKKEVEEKKIMQEIFEQESKVILEEETERRNFEEGKIIQDGKEHIQH